jgi:hypothetical protein
LAEQQREIDDLNVFPVPDGDTGRNMYLTMLAAVREMDHATTCSLSGISEALAKGSLMGARGNSGVILSQLIRGFADAVKGHEEITLAQFARAWHAAVVAAYKAVMKPVEGTMLTVARGFSQGLGEAAKTDSNLVQALLVAVQKGNETLQMTPELLPVLKRAGVVDAGGKGLLVLLEGGVRALDNGGEAGAAFSRYSTKTSTVGAQGTPDSEGVPAPEDDFDYTYCVELLLEGDPACMNQLRINLSEYGGSLIVGNIDDVIKIHVHSNHPGQVLEYCQQYGSLHDIKINNMRDQWQQAHGAAANRPDLLAASASAFLRRDTRPVTPVHRMGARPSGGVPVQRMGGAGSGAQSRRVGRGAVGGGPKALPAAPIAASGPDPLTNPDAAAADQVVGVLAVASGEGIREIFRSLGAAQIIDGGQTMNPPVEEFVRAIEAMPQAQVLILPNNKNLILAAEQARRLVGRRVDVIATTGIQAGIAAMLSFNPARDLAANRERMERSANRIRSAEVTYAVRDTVVQGAAVKQGSLIGLWQGEIAAVGTSLEQVVLLLVDQMLGDRDELVTLFVGEGVTQEEAGAIAAAIRASHPGIAVEVRPGGQPVYYFLISVE